jgi:hypothetical protein
MAARVRMPLKVIAKSKKVTSASELYRPSDRRISAKLVPIFAYRGCRVVSATDPDSHILGFLDRTQSHSI